MLQPITMLTTRPWIRFLTFCTVASGWFDASFNNVDKKFLHFRTLSSISLLAVALVVGVARVDANDAAELKNEQLQFFYTVHFYILHNILTNSK